MHNMKYIIAFTMLLLLLTLFLQSCLVQGLTNDYNQLTEDQKSIIQPFTHVAELEPDKVYKVNAAQLKAAMKESPKSIVHIFNGACPHYTTTISDFEKYAEDNGYQLFMVLIAYTDLSRSTNQHYEDPLYIIDNNFYGERVGFRYVRFFRNHLTGKPIKSKGKDLAGDFFYFEYDELIQITDSLQ
jgi:hypothetical protein